MLNQAQIAALLQPQRQRSTLQVAYIGRLHVSIVRATLQSSMSCCSKQAQQCPGAVPRVGGWYGRVVRVSVCCPGARCCAVQAQQHDA